MKYLKLGVTPIDEQNPTGTNIKYDEDFEKIESEISKLTSPSASGEIDWGLVAKLSENILETKSKNILVSVYLSYALFKTKGIDGLSNGIKVLADLLENYWEGLYPPLKRIKGRKNAIEWLLDKLNKEFENIELFEVQNDFKEELLANLKKIDNFLNEHIDDAPLFYNLIKLIDMKLSLHVESKQEIVEEKIKEDTLKSQQDKKPLEDTPIVDKDVEKDFLALVSSLSLFTGEMIKAKDYRSELFVITRAFAWLDIYESPSSTNNATMLSPPDTQEIELLQKLYDEKDFSSLLWTAESRITTYLFWLDLHFYVAESLSNLGQIQASQSVLEQTRYFVKKLPKLENLTFSDSTPFANKMTKKWLSLKEKERTTIKEKEREKIPCDSKGIDKLSKLMKSATSVEDEVLYNIEVCRCLANSSNEILITTYTKQLLDRVEEYKINRWKPKIALDAYLISIECLDNISQNDKLIKQLYKKIALIKPSLIDS